MLVTLTTQQMLERRRLMAGLKPLRSDCTIEAVEGVDVDAIITAKMRAWYLRQLDSAPTSMVPLGQFAQSIAVRRTSEGWGEILRPEGCRRLITVCLDGWEREAMVTSVDCPDIKRLLHLAINKYCRPDASAPIAAELPDGRVIVAPMPTGADVQVESAWGVADPGPDSYVLDESLLDTMPSDDILIDL